MSIIQRYLVTADAPDCSHVQNALGRALVARSRITIYILKQMFIYLHIGEHVNTFINVSRHINVKNKTKKSSNIQYSHTSIQCMFHSIINTALIHPLLPMQGDQCCYWLLYMGVLRRKELRYIKEQKFVGSTSLNQQCMCCTNENVSKNVQIQRNKLYLNMWHGPCAMLMPSHILSFPFSLIETEKHQRYFNMLGMFWDSIEQHYNRILNAF